MPAFLTHALHDGSLWLVLVCVAVFAGVAIGLYSRSGSEISSHPYAKTDGGELATDMPPEAIGRREIEPLLSPLRAGHHPRRNDI